MLSTALNSKSKLLSQENTKVQPISCYTKFKCVGPLLAIRLWVFKIFNFLSVRGGQQYFFLYPLGAIHQGRPAYPGERGSWKTGHLLLFQKKLHY